MRIFLLFMFSCFLAGPAQAQVIVIEHFCRQAPEYVPEKGVEYTSGVDVNGKPVVAADLNQPLKALEYPIEIPVEIDLLKTMNLDVPQVIEDSGELEPTVANVMVYEDGHTEYNGQDISDHVTYLCREGQAPAQEKTDLPPSATPQPVLSAPVPLTKPEENKAPKDNGQAAPDTVTSDTKLEGQYP